MPDDNQIELVTYKNNRTGQKFSLRKGSVAERRTMAKFRGQRVEVDGTEKPLVEQVGQPKKVTPKSRRQRRNERRQHKPEPQGS